MFGPTEWRRWLRGLLVVAPVAGVVFTIEILSDTLLDGALPFPWDAVVVTTAVLVLGTGTALLGLRRIDALNRELAARNRDLEVRAASARALHRVSVAIAALSSIDAILDAIVIQARLLVDADVAILLLTGPDGRPRLRASSGPAAPRDGAENDDLAAFIAPEHMVAHLSAPLQRGGETAGLLGVGLGRPRAFGVDDVETLASLANQASIALENARLEGRLRELAVVAERERIARELHDGVSQVLGYVNTKSQAIDELLDAGRVPEARSHLGQLAAAARSVYVDVREAILGLRNPISPREGLVSALETHAAAFADAAKLAITVRASPAGRAASLAPEAEVQAFRIVQEALTNVRKHAAARRVDVTIDVEAEALVVLVHDDGRGFPAAAAGARIAAIATGRDGYGLRAMTERAESVGGSLAASNAEGGGAQIRLTVPLALGVGLAASAERLEAREPVSAG